MRKNKILRLLVLALALLFTLPFLLPSTVSADGTEGLYLALGDSISTGYGLSSPDTAGFTAIVSERLGLTLENRAVNGYTAEDILLLLDGGALDEPIARADLITVTCGGNDLMELLYGAIAEGYNAENDPDISDGEVLDAFAGTHPTLAASSLLPYATAVLNGFAQSERFEAGLHAYTGNIKRLFAELRDRNDHATIVLCTQYNPYLAFKGNFLLGSLYTEVESGVTALNRVIESYAEPLGYTVADCYSAFNAASQRLVVANMDSLASLNLDFHPNAAGHAVIAETVLSAVARTEETTEETIAASSEVGTDETTDAVTDETIADVGEEITDEITDEITEYVTDEITEPDVDLTTDGTPDGIPDGTDGTGIGTEASSAERDDETPDAPSGGDYAPSDSGDAPSLGDEPNGTTEETAETAVEAGKGCSATAEPSTYVAVLLLVLAAALLSRAKARADA